MTYLHIYITRCLKGQCHEMEICFEGLNILFSTFCVCADGFQDLSKASVRYIIINFSFSSFKLLSNFENAYLKPSSDFPSL